MRRLLAGAVAMEMLLGGLAVVALSGGAPSAFGPFGASPRAELTGTVGGALDGGIAEGGAEAGQGSGGARVGGRRRDGAKATSPDALSTGGDDADASAASPHRRLAPKMGISFKSKVDFATGATPPSAAFNVAYGEGPLPVTRATPLTDGLAVGDFNHDGKPDVAQSNVVAGSVSVFLGNGDSGFSLPQEHHVGVNPVSVVAGDLDLDDNVDLVVANYGSNNVAVLHGDGHGSFQLAFSVPVPTPRNVAIGEFNGDDIPDLAVASLARNAGPEALPTGGLTILTGRKGGSFMPAQFISPTMKGRPVGANFVSTGDFDGSGSDDLAVGLGNSNSAGDPQAGDTQSTGDDVVIYLNRHDLDGDGPISLAPEQAFSTLEQQRIRVGSLPNAISVADLNSDAHPDLAVVGATSGDITTLLGDSEGHFVVKATNVTVGAMPYALAAGDFDDDEVVDLVTANWMSSTVSVLEGKGDGTFEPAVDFWSGDATTSAAAGDFNDDGRVDIVAARLRNDHLALLTNESAQPGDRVVITRDISYGSDTHPTNDPFAAHHTLDVYAPPAGTVSFAGAGHPYPVVLFAHGGGGMTGDKTLVSYLMRTLAVRGLVAVSIDYRLGLPPQPDQLKDVAQAFRWVRDNVGSAEYGGDPSNIFVSGTSAGGVLVTNLATQEQYRAEQKNIRGLVLASGGDPGGTAPSAEQPPSLLLNGDQGGELNSIHWSLLFCQRSTAIGRECTHVIVPGRDHVTLSSNLAGADDVGRVAMIDFMRSHLAKR